MAIRKINKNPKKNHKNYGNLIKISLKIRKMQKCSNIVPPAMAIRKINKDSRKFTKILEI